MSLLSVIIPSRQEPYLSKTILDILQKCRGEVEVLAILDGYWCSTEEVIDDPRVNYLHYSESKGMRNAINMGVALAKGEYILKCDAHVSFAEGFDTTLIVDHQDKWIQVPSRYPLDPVKWEREVRTDDKYPVEYESLDPDDLHGVEWREKRDERKDIKIDEIISAQGSCWLTTKKFFEELGGLDEENYGSFFLEFQELSFKAWTNGGQVMVNKNTHYLHWHKQQGRGYSFNSGEREKAVKYMQTWKDNPEFIKILKRFLPMPNWKFMTFSEIKPKNYDRNANIVPDDEEGIEYK